jgi:hypothetical protein
MKIAKEDLIHEHKAIQHALNILERMSDRIEGGTKTCILYLKNWQKSI